MRAQATIAAALALAGAGCIPSNVVAPEERTAGLAPEELAWEPYSGAPLEGFYSSVSISGDLALALLKVDYLFMPDGRFTGAALLAGEPPLFQVLSGSWILDDQGLRLADGPPARLEEAPGLLRVSGPEGTVVLRLETL